MIYRLTSLAFVLVIGLTGTAAAEVIYQGPCSGSYLSSPVRGTLTIERWSSQDTHRIFGEFHDALGNLLNFEVMTNQPGGWGELWVNHAWHRGQRVLIKLGQNGFVAYPESGGTARFTCG
jgi:hypothetical protein